MISIRFMKNTEYGNKVRNPKQIQIFSKDLEVFQVSAALYVVFYLICTE